MVSLDHWENQINAMTSFYLALDSDSLSQGDKSYAELAKERAADIVILMRKYKVKPSPSFLKRLHANLRTLGRGVEGFDNQILEKQHRSYGRLRIELLEYLEK